MSQVLLLYLTNYWGLVVVALVGILYLIFAKNAKKEAIDLAVSLIVEAEHNAEEYALKTGKDKFAWVKENGYALLPTKVKLFVSPFLFATLIQYAFDNLVDFAEKHKK